MLDNKGFDLWADGYDKTVGVSDEENTYPFAGYKDVLGTGFWCKMALSEYNTPVIIKYPFWRMTAKNPDAICACINRGEAVTPEEIAGRSICIDGDIGEAIKKLA